MSSKEQFRDALKREKQIINELKKIISERDTTIIKLRQLNHQLKNQLSGLPKQYKLKKWWQFWK